MKIIDGRSISNKILNNLKPKQKSNLAVILVGSDIASNLYISIKETKAKQVGIGFKKYLLPANTSRQKLIDLITKLNKDETVTGIIVQLPLPKKFNTDKIISAINPKKDADGIHPDNLRLLKNNKKPKVLPATTGAIIEALKFTNIKLKDQSVAIIGKSKIVGLPTYYYLKNKVAKIDIYDSTTKNLSSKTSRADILIVAIGQPKFIIAKYIKLGAIVVDVGINKVEGKTVGDVDFEGAKEKARYITPVPGGIGPITVAVLLKNVIKLS